DRQEDAHLDTRRVAQLREVDLVLVSIAHAGVEEHYEAQRVVDLEDVVGVVDLHAVRADGTAAAALRLEGSERSGLESADRELAADREPLHFGNAQRLPGRVAFRVRMRAVVVQRLDVAELGIERERAALRQVEE